MSDDGQNKEYLDVKGLKIPVETSDWLPKGQIVVVGKCKHDDYVHLCPFCKNSETTHFVIIKNIKEKL